MITKKEEKSISKVESYAITFISNPIQKLQKLAEQELIKLQSGKRNMEAMRSNFDLLIKRYNLEKSYFGRMANWYGALSWWIKILSFILVAGIAVSIGMLISMPITVASISTVVYLFCAFFFINHYDITERQVARLCKDIVELEQSLVDTIDHFNQLSEKLKYITTNIHDLNKHFLTDMQNMRTNVEELTCQLKRYKAIIKELQDAKSAIVFSTNKTRANLDLGCAQYAECCELIIKQATEINSISTSLDNSDQKLNISLEQLAVLIEEYELHCKRIKVAADCAEVILDKLRTDKIAYQHPEVVSSTISSDNAPLIIDCASQTMSTTPLSVVDSDDSEEDEIYKVLAEARQARENSSKALKKLQCAQTEADKLYLRF